MRDQKYYLNLTDRSFNREDRNPKEVAEHVRKNIKNNKNYRNLFNNAYNSWIKYSMYILNKSLIK